MTNRTKLTSVVLSALITVIIFSSCAQMFQSKLPMGSESNITIDELFKTEVEISQLETPKQVFVSQGQNPTQILISWDAQ